MKFIIVEEDNDSTGETERMRATIRSSGHSLDDIRVVAQPNNSDRPRMNPLQLLKLWEMCGRYEVPFRENDYAVHSKPSAFSTLGMVEGWIGGPTHNGHNGQKQTIYVGVQTNGVANS